MSQKNATTDVWMLARVRGEDGEVLPIRTKQTVSAVFGRELVHGNRAVLDDGQDAAAAPAKKTGTKKAAPASGAE